MQLWSDYSHCSYFSFKSIAPRWYTTTYDINSAPYPVIMATTLGAALKLIQALLVLGILKEWPADTSENHPKKSVVTGLFRWKFALNHWFFSTKTQNRILFKGVNGSTWERASGTMIYLVSFPHFIYSIRKHRLYGRRPVHLQYNCLCLPPLQIGSTTHETKCHNSTIVHTHYH